MTRVRSSSGSQIDDRRGQGGGGGGGFPFPMGGGGGGGGGMGFPTKAGGGILGIIILLAALFLPKLLGGGGGGGETGIGGGAPSEDAKDGINTEIEQVVAGATEDVQAYWVDALPQYFSQPYRVTKTVLFTGGTNTGCGNATSETGPFYCPADDLVYIDLEFLQQLETQLVGKPADLAEQYIIAHEYGHHVQNVLGTNQMMHERQQSDPSNANRYSIALELQADCYAGVWVGDIRERDLLESPTEINEALAAAEAVGDDRIQEKTQGSVNEESWTHGSAADRQKWFTKGLETKDPVQCDTFTEMFGS